MYFLLVELKISLSGFPLKIVKVGRRLNLENQFDIRVGLPNEVRQLI